MLKDSTIELTGNDRYEGYAVDLIDALAPILGINYEIIIEDDGNVGTYNNDTQTWDGMIGKIRAGVNYTNTYASTIVQLFLSLVCRSQTWRYPI